MSHWSLSLRYPRKNLNHHIWSNNGTWWVHYTVHVGRRKKRIRESLSTNDLEEARRRRDALLAGAGALLPSNERSDVVLTEHHGALRDLTEVEAA